MYISSQNWKILWVIIPHVPLSVSVNTRCRGVHRGRGERHLLHDGRARTPEEAILWHGGEATSSQKAFTRLGAEERALLLTFLESL